MRAENIAVIEKNIAFFFQKCYDRYIPETEGRTRPCQDRHGAIGFAAHRKSMPQRMQGYRANTEKSSKNCKGDSVMRIAVPYENGQIFQHFGHGCGKHGCH